MLSIKIESYELALHMAHAEKPFRDFAIAASRVGSLSLESLENVDRQANSASLNMAKSYISMLSENISGYEVSDSTAEDNEPALIVSFKELLYFAEQKGFKKEYAARMFNTLAQAARSGYSNYVSENYTEKDRERNLAFEKPLDEISEELRNIRNFGIGGLVLFSEFTEHLHAQAELHPTRL